MLALDSVGSDMVLELSGLTLMHGHELYYALAAACSQIHLSSQNFIYLIICLLPQSVKKSNGKNRIWPRYLGNYGLANLSHIMDNGATRW